MRARRAQLFNPLTLRMGLGYQESMPQEDICHRGSGGPTESYAFQKERPAM